MDFFSTQSIVERLYGGMDKTIKQVVDILSMDPSSNTSIWHTIQSAFQIILPVGLMVAATFLLITLVEKAVLFQLATLENVAKMFFMFVVGKVILENSFEILGWLYQVVAGLIGDLGTIPSGGATNADIQAMADKIDAMGLFSRIAFMAEGIPLSLINSLLKLVITAAAYGRLVEIYVFTAVAPLPLATLVSETHANIAKRFLQGYIAVCIQGLVMLLAMFIFQGLQLQAKGDDSNGVFATLLQSIVLLGVISKSGGWAKTIAGTW